MALSSGDALAFVGAAYAPSSIDRLGARFVEPLRRLGITSLNALLQFAPLVAARRLVASAHSGDTSLDLDKVVVQSFATREVKDAPTWPVTAIKGLRGGETDALGRMGIKSISDLAGLGQDAEKAILAALGDNGFFEPPSAPAELIPSILGSIATSVRFSTFIKDTALADLVLEVDGRCAADLPISGKLTGPGKRNSFDDFRAGLNDAIKSRGLPKILQDLAAANTQPTLLALLAKLANVKDVATGRLTDIFTAQKCPVVELGYICGHRQQWINNGTNLGEVVHSLSLAPGESRNIAKVNWFRRQAIAREEATRQSESLQADFVQNRALEEITSAVAREHQSGGSSTEASTAATAVSLVGAMAVGAGVGATIGTLVAPGVGTAIGAAIGGGVSGVAAGGLISSQSQALGTIEADTSGDRSIVGDVQQRIQLSTSQTASAVRSLWSTIVVEDTQAENVTASTTNITNYNHMHALNLQYYEVLQHYLVRIEVERVQPILLLPFTFLDFTAFQFVRDYWDVIRPHIDDEGLQAQGDSYFVTEETPTAPDLLPVPPEPKKPDGKVRNLRVSLSFTYSKRVDIRLFAKRTGGSQLEGEEDGVRTTGDVRRRNFSFATIDASHQLDFVIDLARDDGGRFTITMEIERATVEGGDERFEVRNTRAGSVTVADADREQKYTVHWDMPDAGEKPKLFELKVAKRDAILAENAARQAAFDALVANLNRFRERLERLILRRRHFFTRVILNALEPEELTRLIGTVGFDQGSGAGRLPLTAIADPRPIGFSTGAFVLKLRRLGATAQTNALGRAGFGSSVPGDIAALVAYADRTITFFDDRRANDPIVSVDHVYVPTGGLFAEAVLGRSNSAETLDPERFFHWDEAPIPNAAPTVSPVGTETRFQGQDLNVTVPQGNLTIVGPQALPDPTGLQQALAAVQNGNMFRDMSRTEQLATIVGRLADLSQALGDSAGKMTGDAARQALQSATDLGKAAMSAAQALQSETSKGARLAEAAKLDRENAAAAPAPAPAPPPAQGQAPNPPPGPPPPPPPPPRPRPILRTETFKADNLPTQTFTGVEITATFTFMCTSLEGATTGDFELTLAKDGLSVGSQKSEPGASLTVPLFFQAGLAQLPVTLQDIRGPLFTTLTALATPDGRNAFVSGVEGHLLPPNRNNYVFRVVMEMEVIQVQANSSRQAVEAVTGKLAVTIGGEPDKAPEPPPVTQPGTAPAPSSGTPATPPATPPATAPAAAAAKPILERLPKILEKARGLPGAAYDLLSSMIDVTVVGEGSIQNTTTTTDSSQRTYSVRMPTGNLKIVLDKDLSI